MANDTRTEQDSLGRLELPADVLHGIHALRATGHGGIAGRHVHPELIRAYGTVKLACVQTARAIGAWDTRPQHADALERAATEMSEGALSRHIIVDALQGGAGTSLNLNVNEVLANRALEILGLQHGRYDVISPLDDVNRFQSTNDTFPTALRVAAIRLIHKLEQALVGLQESFQRKEKEFDRIVKIGRTEYRDAVLTTLGREMSAYAEAFNRDRWRVYKCEERLRVVNLGGTAIGTTLGAPRRYVFQVVDTLRNLTGIGFARAENLVEATQNTDAFVEVSGILKACATNLVKVAADIRFLSCGPDGGPAELILPPLQAGSSIMPGKVNPVVPEAVTQAAMLMIGYDAALTSAAGAGHLELNPFMPLIADCLLTSLDLLTRAVSRFQSHCIDGLTADAARCRALVRSATATATALIPRLGYARVEALVKTARERGLGLLDACLGEGLLTEAEFDTLTSPEAVCRLGSPEGPA
ncbi:MAG: aspartate ammonia-lyase [Lentisphaerae bacterium RIFOXYC12_FULL_60_16]|nr:MAG: aspartate ammonia-lyase [Lentisphaerae bacterium RIFOXYC12_FULL_60_16]OGV76478.1 MAG: aspartate ammonia-lyase [Lentisphaerae bacterium RIFOXYB12_FULL_60_10]